jgi:dTDP-4-amino-4,6-dideoxygalactose transaminase
MKISYIQHKTIDSELVQKYLKISTDHNQFTNNGPVKDLLEKQIERMINCPSNKRVLCVSNGTTALHALIFHYETKHKRKLKWVSPSFTFPSCVVNETNTRLVDIDLNTYTLRPEDVGDADGIIITNLFGTVVDFDINTFKDKIIIYDNASSFLTCNKDGVNICLLGDASFGSLHHTKTFGFGEGGFLVVDTDEYEVLQAICGFGFHYNRIHKPKSSNFKISEVSAAFILQHIDNYDIDKHLNAQKKYCEVLTDNKDVKIFNFNDRNFYGNLPVVFENPISPNAFRDIGIEANKYYKPIADGHDNATYLYDRIINFPLHCNVTDFEINYICAAIKKFKS